MIYVLLSIIPIINVFLFSKQKKERNYPNMKELYILTKNAEIKPICYLNSYQKWRSIQQKAFGYSEQHNTRAIWLASIFGE